MALKSRLAEIAEELAPDVHAATLAGAGLVEQSAKARVPKVTHKLENAIHVEDTEDGAAVVAGDSEAWYGHLVEHGHTAQDGRSIAPRPFLIPALEANRQEILRTVEHAIKQATA